MAQETIEAIRDAEAAAAAKEKEARESADQLVSKARTDAAALIKSRTDAMKEETQSALTQAGLRNEKIMQDAKILEEAGAFSLVLECVPEKLAADITAALSIPTIGIGAGVQCDGQVLVVNDMLGIYDRMTPKFVKKYANLNLEIRKAVKSYVQEVKTNAFPDEEHSFE